MRRIYSELLRQAELSEEIRYKLEVVVIQPESQRRNYAPQWFFRHRYNYILRLLQKYDLGGKVMGKNVLEKLIEKPFDIVEGLLPRPVGNRIAKKTEVYRNTTRDQDSSICDYIGCKRSAEDASTFCICHMPPGEKEAKGLWEECSNRFYELIDKGHGFFSGFVLKDIILSVLTDCA
jgi:hypothetical protein